MTPNPTDQEHSVAEEYFPQMPTETEIYILPTGEIVVADLPAELAERLAHYSLLNALTETTISNHVADDSDFPSPA